MYTTQLHYFFANYILFEQPVMFSLPKVHNFSDISRFWKV